MNGETPRENKRLYSFGPFRLDAGERRLYREGEPVPLPRKVFDLLLILVENAGHLRTRELLIEALWPKTIVEEQGLSARIHALRRALGDEGEAPQYIETVRGVGYRFIAPVAVEDAVPTDTRKEGPAQPIAKPARIWRFGVGAAVAVVILIAAGLVAWHFVSRPPGGETNPASPPSVAVLPFENLSADPANAYFAAGIQDEILTRLAGIGSLKVISRTSSAQYSSHPANLRTIARQLGVTTVLEGSVQKAGDEVHINVQLIDTRTLAHIWAHSYDRKLTDIFGVEGEVAGKIAGALDARLTAPERSALATKPTVNSAAYEAYLRGLAAGNPGSLDFHAYQQAVQHFEQAVKLDPRFALAWARLAIAQSGIYEYYETSPTSLAKMHTAFTTALRLAPDLGEAWLAKGIYLDIGKGDMTGSLAALKRARERLPNSSEVLVRTAYVERDLGRWKRALALQKQAAQIDPRNVSNLVQWSLSYSMLRQFARAHAVIVRALEVNPNMPYVIATEAMFYQAEGRLDAAAKLLRPLPFQPDKLVTASAKIRQLMYRRDYAAAITTLQSAIASADPHVGNIVGYYCAMLGLAEQRSGNAAGAHASFLAGRDLLKKLEKSGDHSYFLYAYLALNEAGLGEADAARRDGQNGIAAAKSASLPGFVGGVQEYLARAEAQLGDRDGALKLITALLGKPYMNNVGISATPLTVALLRLAPAWDPLRKDPRFQALLHRRAQHAPESASALANTDGG